MLESEKYQKIPENAKIQKMLVNAKTKTENNFQKISTIKSATKLQIMQEKLFVFVFAVVFVFVFVFVFALVFIERTALLCRKLQFKQSMPEDGADGTLSEF